MQPLEIDSAVFCDGARYTIISRENSSILTCPSRAGRADIRSTGSRGATSTSSSTG